MADRIFPTVQGDIGTEKEFSGIDWNDVVKRISSAEQEEEEKKQRFAQVKDIVVAKDDEDEEPAEEATDEDEEEATDEDEEEATDEDEEPTEEATDEDEEPAEEVTDEDEEGVRRGKTPKSARKLKVYFRSAEDISAEALEKAKSEGNELLFNTILAARKKRREFLGNKFAELEFVNKRQAERINLLREAEKEEYINQRHAQRVDMLKDFSKRIASKKTQNIKVAQSDNSVNTVSKEDNLNMKEVKDMNKKEKQAFAQKAKEIGFPQEYIDHILGKNIKSANTEADKVISAMKSVSESKEISNEDKKYIIAKMIKSAELDNDNKQRIIDYWIKDLGYGDQEWVKDWVNATYKDGAKRMQDVNN